MNRFVFVALVLSILAGTISGYGYAEYFNYRPQINAYITEINSLRSELSTTNSNLEAVKAGLSQAEAEIEDLKEQLQDKTNQISTLSSDNNKLQLEITNLRQAQQSQSNRPFYDIYPQTRPEFNFAGEVAPSAGRYHINQSSILVSFPHPDKCLSWSRAAGTGSMRPMLGPGTILVFYTCFSQADIQPGDIVRFTDASGLDIVHQVLEVKTDGVITKGINSPVDDGLIPWQNIKGILVIVIY